MKNRFRMVKILILLLSLVLIAIILLGFSLSSNEIGWDKKWTTAICSGNECQDFLITCSGQEVVDMTPISGLVVFKDDWVDKRKDKELC